MNCHLNVMILKHHHLFSIAQNFTCEDYYAYVKSLRPVLWLSASNFDGDRTSSTGVVTGDASGRMTDSIGNPVTSSGTIRVVNVDGNSAYHFDNTNSIASDTNVTQPYSLLLIYKDIAPFVTSGRFFHSYPGTMSLFGSWNGKEDIWLENNNWVTNDRTQIQTFTMQFLMATSENNVKNMWDVKKNTKPVDAITSTWNSIWGKTVICYNSAISGYSSAVYIFEAMVFNTSLTGTERESLRAIFNKKYNI